MRLRLSRPEPGRPARLPDTLQSVALFLLLVGGRLAFESHPQSTEYARMAEGVGFDR